MVVADFNSDGHQDLAVNRDGIADVLLGNGDGSFQAARLYEGGGHGLAVGDFNTDGIFDLVTSSHLLLGNGDGTFRSGSYFFGGFDPYSVAVGDFNRDGRLDLVVSNSFAPYQVTVLLGDGNGSFAAPMHYGYPSLYPRVAVGDFNGDGALDLAVANISEFFDGPVSVFLGNGDGTFQTARDFPTGLGNPKSVAVSDFNRDGVLDLVLASGGGYPSAPDTVSVLLGLGDGSFLAPIGSNAGVSTWSVAVGDFNGDEWPDLAVTNNERGYGNRAAQPRRVGQDRPGGQPARPDGRGHRHLRRDLQRTGHRVRRGRHRPDPRAPSVARSSRP